MGHSLGGLTIPLVRARRYVWLCAYVPQPGRRLADRDAEAFEPSPLEALPDRARSYIACTDDVIVPPLWQRRMAREELGVEPIELRSGHSPMLSCPAELAEILLGLAASSGGVAEASSAP